MVEKVVLIASAGIKRRRTLKERLRFFYIALLRSVIRRVDRLVSTDIFKSWFVPRYASPDYLAAGPMRDSLVRVINEDLTEAASRVVSPVLLLWGSEDRETPLEMGERLSRIIPRARLKVVPGEGHYPFLGAGAHLCAHAVRKFLAETQTDSEPSCSLEGVGRA
jgi:pimeloyl-ACP methyl ester carboxylesterase